MCKYFKVCGCLLQSLDVYYLKRKWQKTGGRGRGELVSCAYFKGLLNLKVHQNVNQPLLVHDF